MAEALEHGLLEPRGGIATLFEVADPSSDPEGLITKFVAYESFRIKREEHEFSMAGALQDRLGVLFWYLDTYVRDRLFAYVVPLSARQIAYLNSPAPLAGASPAVTVALQNFVARDIPGHLDLLKPEVMTEAVYWWCMEKAPRSRFEDRLVTEEQITLLRAERQWLGEEYPFNAFMSYFFNRHPELHELDMSYPRDRAAYFHYLVLLGFSQPHILRFLPKDALRRTLTARQDGEPVFDRILARHALAGATPAEGSFLRALGEDVVRRSGYSMDRDTPPPAPRDTGECFLGKRRLEAPVEPGIALVGPIRKASGLGQAARLSYDILRRCESVVPTALVFDLDNPAPVGFASSQSFEPYKNRRAINLIHLNAESVPLAFAFEQRAIFESSYNIGYFFWELNMIPKCHRLALELLDEIWVSSDYNREIYSRFTDKPVINVGMAVEPLPQAAPLDRAAQGLDPEAFIFLTTFDSFSFIERKNPFGVLDAFKAAFPLGTEKVQLVLKTQNRGRVFDPYQMALWKRIDRAVGADPRILVINETFQYADLLGLKLACDCYVSLHRSEGWGFGMIEAMQLGRPVIATNYSGNTEFCNAETAYLVGYDLIGVREDEYIFVERGSHWAQPRLDEAATLMRAAFADPAASRAKGEAAATFIKANFSIEAIGQRYAAQLAEVRAELTTGG